MVFLRYFVYMYMKYMDCLQYNHKNELEIEKNVLWEILIILRN